MTRLTEQNQAPSETVLVTGGRGFIGAHLVARLCKAGLRVVSVDIQNGILPKPDGAIQVDLDIRDEEALDALFKTYAFSCVFDLASFTEVGLSMKEYERNVDQTKSMVRAVKKFGTPKYIFYSTQFVHRVPNVEPASEEDYAPTECYGASKVISEKYIRENLPLHQWLILRPTYIWGAGLERFRDGLLYRLARGQFLMTCDPSFKRYYGYVETVADQTYVFYTKDFSTLSHKVYYISDDAIQIASFCQFLTDALGQGKAWRVPSCIIRFMGFLGKIMNGLGLPWPINPIQARELTTNFPIPLARTLEETGCKTHYKSAAERTVAWAKMNDNFRTRIKG